MVVVDDSLPLLRWVMKEVFVEVVFLASAEVVVDENTQAVDEAIVHDVHFQHSSFRCN